MSEIFTSGWSIFVAVTTAVGLVWCLWLLLVAGASCTGSVDSFPEPEAPTGPASPGSPSRPQPGGGGSPVSPRPSPGPNMTTPAAPAACTAPATWAAALDRWGSMSLADLLEPAADLARDGFVVDKTFHQQTDDNRERFNAFTSTRKLFLRHGKAPKVGSLFRNPQLADTYDLLAKRGMDAFYKGKLANQIAKTVRKPPKRPQTDLPVPKGSMRPKDLARYDVIQHRPTHVGYRGFDVYGMPPSSSGGTTVNILTYTYDAAGNRLTAADQNGIVTMTHDALHRVTRVQQPFGVSLTFTYDANSNRTRVEDSFGAVETSTYDAANRLTNRELANSGQASIRLDFTYNDRNQLTGVTMNEPGVSRLVSVDLDAAVQLAAS